MTILFFARRFYPQIGGVEKHVLEIGKRLVKQGHKVIVVAELEKNTNDQDYHSVSKSATSAGRVEGIEIYRINAGKDSLFKKFRIWKELWRLRRLVIDADVVHCHDVFFWYLPFKCLYFTKKVYTTFHGYEGNFIPIQKAIVMHKVAEKLSNGNICIGQFFEKWYGTKPTYISFGAAEILHLNNQNKTDKNLIVFLGRLEEETGIMEYLKAFEKISQKYKQLTMEVLGDGALMGEAKKYALDNQLSVNFRGFVAKPDESIQRASFMFVSRYLGMLEAMVSKKYVLAVYNNEIKEDYLRMTPFSDYISISCNSDEIYKELEKFLSNEALKNEKIKKAYEWVKDKTWENMVNTYISLWQRI
jgi:glycosyltransferase involved in cell wall biosynthesis